MVHKYGRNITLIGQHAYSGLVSQRQLRFCSRCFEMGMTPPWFPSFVCNTIIIVIIIIAIIAAASPSTFAQSSRSYRFPSQEGTAGFGGAAQHELKNCRRVRGNPIRAGGVRQRGLRNRWRFPTAPDASGPDYFEPRFLVFIFFCNEPLAFPYATPHRGRERGLRMQERYTLISTALSLCCH